MIYEGISKSDVMPSQILDTDETLEILNDKSQIESKWASDKLQMRENGFYYFKQKATKKAMEAMTLNLTYLPQVISNAAVQDGVRKLFLKL